MLAKGYLGARATLQTVVAPVQSLFLDLFISAVRGKIKDINIGIDKINIGCYDP